MTDDKEHFIAGMAHCYDLLAQELRVKREAFQTVWDFYYDHPEVSPDGKVADQLAFASSFMEQLEKNIEGTYFDALDVEKGNAPLEWG
jgi:hypothetical protein